MIVDSANTIVHVVIRILWINSLALEITMAHRDTQHSATVESVVNLPQEYTKVPKHMRPSFACMRFHEQFLKVVCARGPHVVAGEHNRTVVVASINKGDPCVQIRFQCIEYLR